MLARGLAGVSVKTVLPEVAAGCAVIGSQLEKLSFDTWMLPLQA